MQRRGDLLKAVAILAFCFSAMMLMGLNFHAGFHQELEITNRTAVPVSVTPIGVEYGSDVRGTLPISASRIIHWPALQDGDFTLSPGHTIKIVYDSDDVEPSEIYVNAGPARIYEKSVKRMSANDFDHDKDLRIEVLDFASLPAASASVTAAAIRANQNEWKVVSLSLVLIGPLVFGAGLWVWARIMEREKAPLAEAVKKAA